jgi:DNA-directed RNA polymerase subunit RPC12/RpoP
VPEKTKSYYCEVCGRQSRFVKTTRKHGSKMMSRAYDDMNPIAAATGGMLKLGGAAANAAKSYRCVTCGSKKGEQSSAGAPSPVAVQPVAAQRVAVPPPPPPVPAGWYPDPQNPRMQRWWDGGTWTEHHAAR